MRAFRLVSKLVCLLVAGLAMVPPASAQSGYQDPYANPYGSQGYGSGAGYGGGYGASGQAAAPSTIPGNQGGGTAVPQVQPPPVYAPKRKPLQPGAIPWGGSAGSGLPEPDYGGMGGGTSSRPPASGGSAQPGWGDPVGGYPAADEPLTQAPPSTPSSRPVLAGKPKLKPVPAEQSPMGSPAPMQPAPMAEAPPAATQRPKQVVTPGIGAAQLPTQTDMASANERLRSAYPSLQADANFTAQMVSATSIAGTSSIANSSRISRVGTSPGTTSVLDDTQAQRIAAPAVWCARNGNTPVISRIRPATETGLLPGVAFVVQGNCFGDRGGSLRVNLPTQFGRIRAVEAQVLNWEGTKVFAQLPGDIVNVIPGEATMEVVAAAGLRSAGKPVNFEPRWERIALPAVESRVRDCRGEGSVNRCRANDDSEADPRFNMPKDCRYSGIGTCYGQDRGDPQVANGEALIFGQHYTEDLIRFRKDRPSPRGRDSYELSLPPYLKPSHCDASVTAFETEAGRLDASASAHFDGSNVVVDWSFDRYGEPGWLQYRARCQVWAPVGVALR